LSKKCLVTGARGFIGSHLVNYLKGKGYYVRSVDNKDFSYLKTNEDEFKQLDLRVAENAKIAVRGMDRVFNLAANMGGIQYISEYNASIMRDNVLINVNMLDAAHEEGVERYFFSSSACAYPRELQTVTDVTPLKESDVLPAHPDSAYGWEKLFTELLCASYKNDYKLPVRVARFHNIYGAYTTYKGGQEKAPAAVCRKIAEAKNGDTVEIWGDGQQTRSFLNVKDCVEAILLLTESDYSEPMNIGTDRLISILDLYKMVARIAGKEVKYRFDLTKPQGVRGRNADLTLIKKVLRWEPKISLEAGMKELYDWVSKQLKC